MSYVDLDTIQRPANGMVVEPAWGAQVNDNFTALAGLLTPTMIGARMYQSTGQTAGSGAIFYLVNLDTVDFVGGTGSPTCVTAADSEPYSMTIVKAGKYLVTGRLATSYPTGQTGPQPAVAVLKNGSYLLEAIGDYMAGNPSGIGPTVEVTSLVQLAAGDILELYASSFSSSYLITAGGDEPASSYLSALYVGA